MTVNELKLYIYKKQKIEYILEKLNCHNIKYQEKSNCYSASFPDGDNPQGINIKNNEYLNYRSFSRNVSFEDGKDIISMVEYIKKLSFIDAVKYLHKILDIEYKWKRKPEKKMDKVDPLAIFKKVQCKKKVDVSEIHVLEDDVLNDYVPLLYIGWLREGIMPWTAKKFGLAYSYKRKRVVIAHRYWLTGELVGLNMRTTVENYEELGISKYWITPTYQKSSNLFGLYENYDSIQKAGYVVVYESEKSVLKRDSLCDSTGVALSGKSMSDEQARILIGLNVDIVISLDKNVPIEEVRHICSKFYNIRNVYYTYDKWDLLDKKESIADKPDKIFNFFIRHKIKYDRTEHQEYLKSFKRR